MRPPDVRPTAQAIHAERVERHTVSRDQERVVDSD